MAEFLRRVDLVHPNTGPQITKYHVKIVDEPTLLEAQVAANAYFILLEDPAIEVRALLIDTQYHYIPRQVGPVEPERHVVKMTFASVGNLLTNFPT